MFSVMSLYLALGKGSDMPSTLPLLKLFRWLAPKMSFFATWIKLLALD